MPTLRRSLSVLALVTATLAVAHAQTPLRLQPVTPCRLVDTRQQNNGNGFQGTMTFNLPQLAMNGGNQGQCTPFSLAAAQAYSLNVTLVTVNSGHVGYLTIWPAGETQPLVSLMNSDGRTKANAAIVPAGTNGEVSVYVTNTTNVLIDINAYFDSPGTDPSDLAFFPLTPCRLVDTRSGDGGTLMRGQERDYLIPPTCGIPTAAAAYSFNVTVLPAAGGLDYLTVWPQGEPRPVVSTLNDVFHGQGTAAANAAIVPAGANNTTAFYPHSNNTDLLVDVNGYFAPASSGPGGLSLFTLTPCRVLDTRGGIGEFTGTIPVGIVGSLCGIPGSTSEAFVLNATVVPDTQTHLSYLTLWPEGETMPTVSTLNAPDGAVTSNMAIVPAGTGNDSISAFAGEQGRKYTNLILDISSYFAPVPMINIETTVLPDGVVNSGYSVPLAAAGGVPPYTWMQAGGSLPPGLTLSNSGTISGTPISTGTYNFGVQATDSELPAQTESINLQIIVRSTSQTLAVTTTTLPGGTVNTPYNALLTANGGVTPYTWSIMSGALPAGLMLAGSTGQITGTPQAPGYSALTVQVTDAMNHTAIAVLPIAIDSGSASGTLNGRYAGSFSGYDHGNWFVAQFSITADGAGNITSGEVDSNNSSSGVQHSTITSGTYTVASNGLGQISWSDSTGGNVQLLISVGGAEDIRVISYNTQGSNGVWGAGFLRQQNPSASSLAPLAGTWTFGFQGFQTGNAAAGAGLFHQDASGNLNGQEDINVGGQESTLQFTGSMTAPDGNGRVTLQLQFGHEVQNYAGYLVSASQVLVTSTDSGHQITSTSLRQSGTLGNGIFHGKAVGRESRSKNNGMIVSDAFVLLVSFDGAGNDNLTIDENFDGTLLLQQMGSGNYSVNPATGQTFIGAAGGGDLCYPVQQNEAFCFDPSSGHPGMLFLQAQAAGPFNTPSLAGQYLGGSLPQFVSTTDSTIDVLFLDGGGNGSLTYSQTGPDPPVLNQAGTGTYTVDATGHLTLMSAGSPVAYGYLVGPDRFFAISTDGDPRTLIHVKSSAP